MILEFKKAINLGSIFSAVLMLVVLSGPRNAAADLWGCVFTNGQPCTWVLYDTDKTCADITLSNIGIQQCVDVPIAPIDGAGLPGSLTGVHPDLDGLPNIGSGPFPGTIQALGRTLDNFIVTRPYVSRLNFDPLVLVLAFDSSGNIYTASPLTGPVEPFDPLLHDFALQVTPGADPILSPFDGLPLGVTATGDLTVSVHVFGAGDGSVRIADVYFPIVFGDLQWTLFGSGAVANTPMTWSAVKAMY